jgi:hypothetical protein
VFFVERSMAPGYAGIDTAVLYKDNTMMPFSDAKGDDRGDRPRDGVAVAAFTAPPARAGDYAA